MNKKAFTLVELIVVITILAILWTIWFTTYTGYTSEARDSSRLADLSNIKKAIDLYEINNSKLPEITSSFDVYFWANLLFSQWTFWSDTVPTLKWLINEVPKDPVTWDAYSYSLSQDKTEYETGWFLENEKLSYSPISKANAWTTIAQSVLRWNYNWQFIKIISWDNVLAFASPSITTNNTEVNSLQDVSNQNLFVYDGFYNLPANFVNSRYSVVWSTTNRFLNTDSIEIYNWTLVDLNQDVNQLRFIENLQNAYRDTDLSSKFIISKLLSKDLNSSETLKDAKIMLNTLVSDKISIK